MALVARPAGRRAVQLAPSADGVLASARTWIATTARRALGPPAIKIGSTGRVQQINELLNQVNEET
jgi:hypothetical protein